MLRTHVSIIVSKEYLQKKYSPPIVYVPWSKVCTHIYVPGRYINFIKNLFLFYYYVCVEFFFYGLLHDVTPVFLLW